MTSAEQRSFDVAVVGGGATGYAAALTAADAGLSTILFAPAAAIAPARTAALLGTSIDVLERLGVWPDLAPFAAALRSMRLVDATHRLIRAPEVTFHAGEIGLAAFGYNIPNADLLDGLGSRARDFPGLVIAAETVTGITHSDDTALLDSADRKTAARLVVAADGARSPAREASGIGVRTWSYKQAALVATFGIEAPHAGVSTEFHTESGPFTLVPLPGDRVSLVWVDLPERAAAWATLEPAELARVVEAKAQSIHGKMQLEAPPALFPLGAALAHRFAARRTMLVGEAAHLFPPIGAQGLNLGFRDVAALQRILTRYRDDPGAPAATEAYHAARQSDVRSRTLAVDLLNRSLLTDFLPVQAARGLGLAVAGAIPPLRRALMRQGLAPGGRAVF